MTKISLPLVFAGALIGAILGFMTTCQEPAMARPVLENYPPKVGGALSVTVVCAVGGASVLLGAFKSDVSWIVIGTLYRQQLDKGQCVVPDRNFPVVIIEVGETIKMSSGEEVFPLTVLLAPALEPVYTFLIINTVKQAVSV